MAEIETVRSGHVVIGVDTHKYIHVAAVMDSIGGILATLTITTDMAGFKQLLDWASSFWKIIAFGIEGTGSYGAGLTSFVRRHGHKVIEVSRPDRRLRRLNGKSDTLDAENAARAVLAGFATVIPKTADGVVERIRQLKVAHDTAVKDRTGAMITLKAMLVHAAEDLRRETAKKTQKQEDAEDGRETLRRAPSSRLGDTRGRESSRAAIDRETMDRSERRDQGTRNPDRVTRHAARPALARRVRDRRRHRRRDPDRRR